MSYVKPLMRQNFLEYASYVIVDRAIPDLRDGLKPVQRRILQTLHEMDDGRFHKVQGIMGQTMKLHPHGDASIGDALVVLANKEYFIERQGNFGNILTGHRAAAGRYIECRLTPLAKETLFHDDLTEFQPSYDGRKDEPLCLWAKLPVVLMLGTEGIAVGMSTRILPHNFGELLQAQIDLLNDKAIALLPDFQQGGVMDASEYEDGLGKVKVRAKLEVVGEKQIVISEVPFSTTTESLVNSIESAVQKGKVKISSIEDRTAEEVEIVLSLTRGVYADEVVPQLYAYTDCEVSINSNLLVIHDRRPRELTVTEALTDLTKQLKARIKAELEWELGILEDRQHWLTLEQIFIENRVYKRIEEATTDKSVRQEVFDGMEPFKKLFIRPMVDEDVTRLLDIRIRRISAYDIEKHRKDLDDIIAKMKTIRGKLRRLKATTIAYLDGLLERYGKDYPRRTSFDTFQTVDKRAVARQHLKLTYDSKSGFFGHGVRGKDFQLSASDYDKILLVASDGSYRIIEPPEKLLIPGKLKLAKIFNTEDGEILTALYRDKKKEPFAKKVHIKGFIKGKEYELIKGREGRLDHVFEGESDKVVHIDFLPAKYQRVTAAQFDLKTLDFCGIGARGTRMATKGAKQSKLIDRDKATLL